MDLLRFFNIDINHQRQLIVWLSGFFGLLLGIISLFLIELRRGIESWLHLVIVLVAMAMFVLICNAAGNWLLKKKYSESGPNAKIWLFIITGMVLLFISAIGLAVII